MHNRDMRGKWRIPTYHDYRNFLNEVRAGVHKAEHKAEMEALGVKGDE